MAPASLIGIFQFGDYKSVFLSFFELPFNFAIFLGLNIVEYLFSNPSFQKFLDKVI